MLAIATTALATAKTTRPPPGQGDRPQRRITCVSIAAHPARADDVLTELHELGGAREGRNKALVIFRPVASDSGGQQPAQRSS
jgi:hypothetical protein